MDKKARSKNRLKPKSPFKWDFMDIIPATAPKRLTDDTNFYNLLLIVDTYSKNTKLYGMDKFSTEEVMDNLYMFQYRFGNLGEFGWWNFERISVDVASQFTSTDFK